MPDQTALAPNLADAVEFAENPEPRCPCVLLVDTSGSMQGAPMAALNEGLRAFKNDLMKDALASRRVEVAIVTFSSDVQIVQDFVTADQFEPPTLHAEGATLMGSAIHQALDLLAGAQGPIPGQRRGLLSPLGVSDHGWRTAGRT